MRYFLRGACLILIGITTLLTNKGMGQTIGPSQGGGGFGCSNSTSSSGGSGTDALTISPSGTVTVTKDDTQQFTANKSDVTWSIVTSADISLSESFGEISTTGLYTPPSTLPLNPSTTLRGCAGSECVDVTINLRTGDSITFPATDTQLNTTENFVTSGQDFSVAYSGIGHRLDTTIGSLHKTMGYLTELSGSRASTEKFGLFNLLNVASPVEDYIDITATNNEIPLAIFYLDTSTLAVFYVDFLANRSGSSMVLKWKTIDESGTTQQNRSSVLTDVSGLQFRADVYKNGSYFDGIMAIWDAITSPTLSRLVFFRCATDGSSCTSSTIASSSSLIHYYPEIISIGDTLHICYMATNSAGTNQQIYYTQSTDAGSSFSSPTQITNDSNGWLYCQIDMSPLDSNKLYLTMSGESGGSRTEQIEGEVGSETSLCSADCLNTSATGQTYFSKSTDNGTTWSTAAPIGTGISRSVDSVNELIHFMEVDSLGRIDLVYGTLNDSRRTIYHTRSSDEGSTWTTPVALGTLDSRPVGVNHDISGRLHIFYHCEESASSTNYCFNSAE
ncbi:MAG: exo-alpha-sialidase [Deltaproteobacteria bacterium]|nr:exo-alpha-sialidase [Deltaproteobacteria bacterium]